MKSLANFFFVLGICHWSHNPSAQAMHLLKMVPGKWCGSATEIKTVYNPIEPSEVPEGPCLVIVITNHVLTRLELPEGTYYVNQCLLWTIAD